MDDDEKEGTDDDEFQSLETDSNKTNKNAGTSTMTKLLSNCCLPLPKIRTKKRSRPLERTIKTDLPVAYITSFVLEIDSHPVDQGPMQ